MKMTHSLSTCIFTSHHVSIRTQCLLSPPSYSRHFYISSGFVSVSQHMFQLQWRVTTPVVVAAATTPAAPGDQQHPDKQDSSLPTAYSSLSVDDYDDENDQLQKSSSNYVGNEDTQPSLPNPLASSSHEENASDVSKFEPKKKRKTAPVPPPPNLHGKQPRKYWNAAALAFLGDAVWELYVRRKNFHPPTRVSAYYATVVSQVRAEAQSKACEQLECAGGVFLTQEERDVLRWGRNATGTSPKRLSQGAFSKEIYRSATAIECLVGWLYLTDAGRLQEVMEFLGMENESGSLVDSVLTSSSDGSSELEV